MHATDSIPIVGQTLAALNGAIAFGDTDHDGRNELLLAVSTIEEFSFRILEYQADWTYREEFVGPYLNPYAVGDLDQDGRSDVVGQYGNVLRVYESADASSYPTTLVWQSPPMTNTLGYLAVGDTDRDGRMESIHSRNSGGSRLVIFENKGDDDFELRLNILVDPLQETGAKLIADLDRDGLTEIVFCGTNGVLHVFESPMDDVWIETYTTDVLMSNAYAVTGGEDTDGNGKLEIFVSGSGSDGRITAIYEACADNTFHLVQALSDVVAGGANCIANIDGVGRPEYVLQAFRQLVVYRGIAPGQWVIAAAVTDPDSNGQHSAIAQYDVNQNGRPELYWSSEFNTIYGTTLILEGCAKPPTDSRSEDARRPFSAFVWPTPSRTQAFIRFDGGGATGSPPASATVFDVAGRVVLRQKLALATERNIVLPVQTLRSGSYVVRLDDRLGQPLATARAIVVR